MAAAEDVAAGADLVVQDGVAVAVCVATRTFTVEAQVAADSTEVVAEDAADDVSVGWAASTEVDV